MLLYLALLCLFVVVGFSFYQLPVSAGFMMVAAVIVILVTAYRLLYGLALMTFAIALSPEITLAGIPVRVEDLIIPVIFTFWFFQSIRYRKSVKPTRLMMPLAAFLFFMAVATLNAFIVDPSTHQLQATFHFLKHVEYVLIFFLVLNIVDGREDIRFLAYAALLAALIVAAQAQPQFAAGAPGGGGGETAREVQRIAGVETETANIFGGYLMFHFMIALCFFLEEKRWTHWFFFLAAMLAMVQPIAFTRSRSTYTGLSAAAFFLVVIKRDWRVISLLIMAPFVSLMIFPDLVIDRFMSIFIALSNASLTPSWQARLEAWKLYLPTVIRYPIIGRGLFYVPMGEIDNDYVLRLVQTGLLGFLSFLWVFLSLARRSWNLFAERLTQFDRQLGLGYLSGLVGIAVHSLAATTFTTIRTAEPIFLFSGLVVAGYLEAQGIGPEHTVEDITAREQEKKFLQEESR